MCDRVLGVRPGFYPLCLPFGTTSTFVELNDCVEQVYDSCVCYVLTQVSYLRNTLDNTLTELRVLYNFVSD
jgi:hypothetical protein